MYELKVKKDNTWYDLDIGSKAPAMTYTSNDIAELQNRKVDGSLRLTLPFSKANNAFFENTEIFEVETNLPYTTYPCRLYANEYEIAANPILILDKISNKGYETQILSGGTDIIQLLKDTPMKDTNLGYAVRGIQGMLPETFNPTIYRYAIATFKVGGGAGFLGMPEYNFPFVRQSEIMKRIINGHGFSWEHNISSSLLDKRYLSLASIKQQKDSYYSIVSTSKMNFSGFVPSSKFPRYAAPYYMTWNTAGQYVSKYGSGQETETGLTFKSPVSGTLRLKVNIRGSYNSLQDIKRLQKWYLLVRRKNSSAITHTIKDPRTSMQFDYNKIIKVEKDEEIQVSIFLDITTMIYGDGKVILGSLAASVEFSEIIPYEEQDSPTPLGGKLYFAPNLGFNTQWDFVKTFVQQYGLTIFPNYKNKVLYTYKLDKLYNNKSIAIDWSEKLNMSTPLGYTELSFKLNKYAQTNYIKFDENTKDDITDLGFFRISNTTLDKTKDLFTIPLESGKNNTTIVMDNTLNFYSLDNVANIPLLTYPEANDTDGKIEFSEGKPHLVELDGIEHDVVIFDFFSDAKKRVYQKASHVRAQTLINENYNKLVDNMLNDAKFIEVELLLTDKDINEFNQFVPVYISHFGAHFFVNKIKNYVSGKPTRVELIKMG